MKYHEKSDAPLYKLFAFFYNVVHKRNKMQGRKLMLYFDYAASAPMIPAAAKQAAELMENAYGNPSSLHAAAAAPRKLLRESRDTMAELLGITRETIIFTSGGTESNNWALTMAALSSGKRRIVLAANEHSSVLLPARRMKQLGFTVTELPPDRYGRILPEAAERALTKDTALLSVHAVNNETGTVQDIEAMAALAHRCGALYHCDAVQSFGHIDLPLSCADFISLSAHKFGGGRGAGVLAVKDTAALKPLLLGGKQEYGLRAGTENVPAIAAMALAAEISCASIAQEQPRIEALSSLLLRLLREKTKVVLNSGDAPHCGGILSLRFPCMNGEELLTRLNERGICISAGAACAAGNKAPSHVLTAMGLSAEEAKESVRISFGRETTEEHVYTLANAILTVSGKGEVL